MPSGGFVIAVSSCLLGLWGATAGPRMPTTMKVNTIRPPVKALVCNRGAKRPTRPGVFSVADSRVNDCIKSVNNQVDDNESRRVCHHDSRDERIITGVQGGDQKATNTRPRKYGFNNDGTAKQCPQLKPDNGNDRYQGSAGEVTPRSLCLRESLGARGDNIFLVHYLQNRRASYPHQDAKHIHTEGQCRHADVRQCVPNRLPMPLQ